MFDTLTAENIREFRQRYDHTHGRYTSENQSLIVKIDGIEEDRVHFLDKNFQRYYIMVGANKGFEFFPLDRKMTNTEDGTVLFSGRKTARQWKRGVCSDNSFITNFSKNGAMPVSINNLEKIFDYPVPPAIAVKNFLKKGTNAVALDSKFAIGGKSLFLFDHSVGTYDKQEIKVISIFHQELQDTLRRENLETLFKVSKYD